MAPNWLRGCATALVTPMHADGSMDRAALRRIVDHQIAGGVKILVPVGTTGESATSTADEDAETIGTVVEQAAGRARVIAGIGSNNTAVAIANARRAKASGADAVLAVAPYYNKPTQAGLLAHYRAIADGTDLPIVIYNVPGRTVTNITAETTLELAETVPHIVATKEASGNFSQIMQVLAHRPMGFRVISGDDATTLPMIALGADGVISVNANQVPRMMHDMVEACLAGRWAEARALHYRMLDLMDGNFVETSPGPVKAGLAMMGLCEEHMRLPLVPPSQATKDKMRRWLTDLGVL